MDMKELVGLSPLVRTATVTIAQKTILGTTVASKTHVTTIVAA